MTPKSLRERRLLREQRRRQAQVVDQFIHDFGFYPFGGPSSDKQANVFTAVFLALMACVLIVAAYVVWG
jgi:hypothetical protein